MTGQSIENIGTRTVLQCKTFHDELYVSFQRKNFRIKGEGEYCRNQLVLGNTAATSAELFLFLMKTAEEYLSAFFFLKS